MVLGLATIDLLLQNDGSEIVALELEPLAMISRKLSGLVFCETVHMGALSGIAGDVFPPRPLREKPDRCVRLDLLLLGKMYGV